MNTPVNPFIQSNAILPLELQTAIEAVNLPEVQEMLKKLSKYNLGIYVPHKHNEDTGDFEVLPDDMLQMENDLQVSFIDKEEAKQAKAIPVAWRWQGEGLKAALVCASGCTYIEHQGREFHKEWHKKV